jgi:hypothetical protein
MYSRKYSSISIQRVSGNFLNAIGGIATAILQKTKGKFLVQLHVTKDEFEKDGNKHCVAYDGVSVRDNFQYATVMLVEESDRMTNSMQEKSLACSSKDRFLK